MECLIGADPEFFVKKDGKFVSAYGLIEGTKKNPQKVPGGAVQVDGMALEFNIDPASTFEEFNNNINKVLGHLRAMVPPEYEFAFVPVAHFDPAYLKDQPLEARQLGCEPDFNAYTGAANPVPNVEATFRTASGHIHIGWDKNQDINDPEFLEACRMMTKQLDVVLATSSILYDFDTTRRQLYGKAGAFRPKPYGVEYRVLSNAWLADKDKRKLVFYEALNAFNKLIKGNNFSEYYGADIQRYINEDKYESCHFIAREFLSKHYPFLGEGYQTRVNIANKARLEARKLKKVVSKQYSNAPIAVKAWEWAPKRDRLGRFAA